MKHLGSYKFHNIDIAEFRHTGNRDQVLLHREVRSGLGWLLDAEYNADVLQAVTLLCELQSCVWSEVL